MRRIARAILALYPASWRARFGDELDEIVASRPMRPSVVLDLAAGAIDAWLHPRLAMAAQPAAGSAPPVRALPPTGDRAVARPGIVDAAPAGVVSRRTFMRRMLGAGVGLLSLEFAGGTLAFLWPKPSGSLGREHAVGTVDEILAISPEWGRGLPWEFRPASAFLVNVPAATAMARGEVAEAHRPGAGEILALWRKCPHLGCMIPNACEERGRFQCYCHQSTYNIIGEKLELGPAPRGMDRFPVRLDAAGVVHVDTREVISGPPRGPLTFVDGWPPGEGCHA
jgi:cytochrome b6-f complex iron-sulfur subunit